MNNPNPETEDTTLTAILRASRATPALPPRFQEGVWRRIEDGEAPDRSIGAAGWLDAFAAVVLRPRLALATVTMLMLAGALLGAHEGTQVAQQDAQARYLAAVAPNSLR